MPKHPTYPPFKTKIVKSGGKKTEKHMITIPKPVMLSDWQSWKITITEDNYFIWEPEGEDYIVEHLLGKFSSTLLQILQTVSMDKFPLFYVSFDKKYQLTDVNAWSITYECVDKYSTIKELGYIDDQEGDTVRLIIMVMYEIIIKEYNTARNRNSSLDLVEFTKIKNLNPSVVNQLRSGICKAVQSIITVVRR